MPEDDEEKLEEATSFMDRSEELVVVVVVAVAVVPSSDNLTSGKHKQDPSPCKYLLYNLSFYQLFHYYDES